MHVALLADATWLSDEPGALRALVVGLLDEQVQVMQIVPEGMGESATSVFSRQVSYRPSRLGWLARRRMKRLASVVAEAGVEVVHAMDGRLWRDAVTLAQATGAAAVLRLSSIHDVPLARGVLTGANVPKLAFTATTEPLVAALRQAIGPGLRIERIAPGVHVPEEPVARRAQPDAPCLVISGTGRYDGQYAALIGSLRRYVQTRPMAQFFFESRSADQHGLWRAGARAGLLQHMSLVPPQIPREQFLLHADALLQPQAAGRSSVMTLLAMASGVPVIALADPVLDYLIDGQTAWVVDQAEEHRWTARLEQLDAEPGQLAALLETARQWCRKRHLVSHRVAQVISVYRGLLMGGR